MILTKEKFIELLVDLLTEVKNNDSLQGNVTYDALHPKAGPDEFEVTAYFRVGNSMGQGGVVMVDPVLEDSEPSEGIDDGVQHALSEG